MHLTLSNSRRGNRCVRLASLVLAVGSVLLAACGGGGGGGYTPPPPPPPTYTAKSGVAQKGPLIKGSTVTAQELDASLSPTGKQYSYQTTSDLGTFAPTSSFSSQYIGLNATGYYFDEVADAVSSGTVTLNGYSDLTVDTVLNVNVLTTLEYQRIQNLVTKSSMTFAAARTQAESEVLAALHIPAGSYGNFGALDLGGTSDGDHILAAISSIFVYGNAAGPLSVLMDNFQSDLGTNGVITSAATKAELATASQSVNTSAVAANLTQEYASVGVTFEGTDIAAWIDQDGDGVVGKFKFQVSDATPTSSFTLPTFVVNSLAGTSVSVSAGQLSVNGTVQTGGVMVQAGDVVAVSPGVGAFPNGVLASYVLSGTIKTARISFISGLSSIAVTPALPSVAQGLTQQFKATGTFSDTSTADLTNSVVWTSGTPSIATVNATSGLAKGIAVGSTSITATSGSVSGTDTLNVTGAVLESVLIAPNPAFSGVGLTNQLMATGTYSDATTADVTAMAQWTSSAPSVATVGPTTGLVTGVSLGSTTVSATIGSVINDVPLSITANGWHPAGNMIQTHAGHTATLLTNGVIMVDGGWSWVPTSQSNIQFLTQSGTELYNPVTNQWSGAPTGLGTAVHTATLLPNGKVLEAGGVMLQDAVFVETTVASAALYDPATNSWSAAPSMANARTAHSATLLPNGLVLIAGGSYAAPLASAELYDPTTNTWSAAGSLANARSGHTATLLPNGLVLAAGGTNAAGTDLVATGELYDPVANTWSPAGSMATARTGHTATLLGNGLVLVAGGSNLTAFASAELYDPVANTWSQAGSMANARTSHTATLLANGTVLVAGGYTQGATPLNSAELYDPVANTWSAAGSMAAARDGHTSTLLSNGVVLVTGGYSTSNAPETTSCELYW
jgi:N-acetylneuraminic acid mutarotase/uncharacterized protein YjdB